MGLKHTKAMDSDFFYVGMGGKKFSIIYSSNGEYDSLWWKGSNKSTEKTHRRDVQVDSCGSSTELVHRRLLHESFFITDYQIQTLDLLKCFRRKSPERNCGIASLDVFHRSELNKKQGLGGPKQTWMSQEFSTLPSGKQT